LHSIFHGKSLLNIFRDKPSVFSFFVRRIVRERLAKANAESDLEKENQKFPDFLSKFIAAQKSHPSVVTDSRIAIYATSNVLAGSLATSQALAAAMTFLSENPAAQDKLFHDIVETENKEANADEASHEKHEEEGPTALNLALHIPYLEAVILESYRLHRTLSTNLERVVSSEGLTLPSGQHLPSGTFVGMNVSTLGRRSDIYGHDADTFNPLRWMQREGEDDESFTKRKVGMNTSMITFGHGSRSCMGKNLVQLEMFKVLATLFGRYNVSVASYPCGDQWVLTRPLP
jgi:cytochrome P450